MLPFFYTPDAIAALIASAESWKKTPFAPAGAVKGPRGGASCHRAVVGILADAGFPITQEEIADAPLNRASHHAGSLMADWLRQQPARFAELPEPTADQVRAGDVLIIRLGIGGHHAVIATSKDRIFQSFERIGVHEALLRQHRFDLKIAYLFRPLST